MSKELEISKEIHTCGHTDDLTILRTYDSGFYIQRFAICENCSKDERFQKNMIKEIPFDSSKYEEASRKYFLDK